MQNVELKVELRDAELARSILKAIGAAAVAVLEQRDVYYRVQTGFLKQRESRVEGVDDPVEIIRYERAKRAAPRISRFEIYDEESAAERFGRLPMTPWVTVEKRRELYMLGAARVHLDEVHGLGRFVEIEVLVTPKQRVAAGHELIAKIRSALGPAIGEPVAPGYAELIAAETGVG